MYLYLRSILNKPFCHLERKKNHSLSGSSLWCVSQDALPLKWSYSWLFIHFSVLPIMPLLNLWSSVWNRKSLKGNPTEPRACCWNRVCTPRIMWVNISYHKLPTEQSNPKLAWRFLSLETFKEAGGEEVALWGTKREPPPFSIPMAHLFLGIWQPHANSTQRTNAKNNCPLKRLYIFTALM